MTDPVASCTLGHIDPVFEGLPHPASSGHDDVEVFV